MRGLSVTLKINIYQLRFKIMRIIHLSIIVALTLLSNCASNPPPANFMANEVSYDYRARHPIVVSNKGAYVPHKCGQWPKDLGSDFFEGMQNRADWNYACSSQQNLAAMISNPNDLITMREETGADSKRRQTMLEKYRQGQDTAIKWGIEGQNKVSKN
jgi:type IV pilus biogenesis protein CpaD/CtpE